MVSAARIVAVGECMLELRDEGDHWRMGYGGDTFNTAIYLARMGEDVAYLTALGEDPFSATLRTAWRAEGLRLDLVLTAPHRLPGLYAIQTDAAGERSFHYWRDQAAVRDLFALPDCAAALASAARAQLLYISGITLALFDADGRAALATLARQVRHAGGTVAFDPNYRPKIWPSATAAREAIAALAPLVTTVLPTFEDEHALHGDAGPRDTHARWHAAGASDIIVKLGAAGCMLHDGSIVSPAAPLTPVDTTGAGDAFNAAYLAARRRGSSAAEAAAFGNLLAGQVIGWRGAILPREQMADFGPPESATVTGRAG